MTPELPKTYDPKAVEKDVYRRWEEAGAFAAEPASPGEPFCIVIPPPNVTAALHLGHALNNTLQDVLVRWRRMQGYNALWMPGTDHAGIATQTVVDKRLLAEGEGGLAKYRQLEAQGQPGREQFVAKVQAWKDEYESTILHQLQQMGCSCDWRRTRFTMDEQCARAVREAFFRLFRDGLIYRGKRLVNWDPATQTVLADDEVEYEEVMGHFWYLKYPLVGGTAGVSPADMLAKIGTGGTPVLPEHVTVATTRPETMLGDTAVAINPRDPRAPFLRGRKVRLPIVGRVVPIIEDEHVVMSAAAPTGETPVEPEDEKARFSTGFLKVTPAHDPDDYAIRERCLARGEPIDIINILAPDGTISDRHGWTDWEKVSKNPDGTPNSDLQGLIGLDRFEAREAVVEFFRKENLLEEVRPYTHEVGHSYRSNVPIEPYLSDQWYIAVKKGIGNREKGTGNGEQGIGNREQRTGKTEETMIPGTDVPANSLAGLALKPLLDGRLKFIPDRYAKTYQTWLENLRDWPISRQLWWGHQIPIWSKQCEKNDLTTFHDLDVVLPDTLEDLLEERKGEHSFLNLVDTETGEVIWPTMNEFNHGLGRAITIFVALKDDKHHVSGRTYHIAAGLERCGFTRDPDVLDTWFSSSLWPFSTMGWPDQTPELKAFYPGDVLCTAREIITLWVSRMVMMGQYCCGEPPFHDVFIHAMIQDGEGRKMSKSLGNGIDPLDIIDSHGADAMRFTLVSMTTQTQDVRMPVAPMKLPDGREVNSSPKIDVGRNFCNKLWNASRFILMNLRPCPPWEEARGGRSLSDRWILSRLSATIRDAAAALEGYRFNELGDTLYHFLWDDFCDWYVEVAKGRLNSGDARPRAILAHGLDVVLRLLHPVAPFITEAIWSHLGAAVACRGPGIQEAEPMLARAAWPLSDAAAIDEKAETDFARFQDLIRQVRNVRMQHNVPPGKRLSAEAHVEAGAEDLAELLAANMDLLRSLAMLEEVKIMRAPSVAGVPGTATGRAVAGSAAMDLRGQDAHATHGTAPSDAAVIAAAGVKLYILGAVDRAAETARLTKQRDTLAKGIAGIEAKLASAGFVSKAPPAVVEKERQRLEALKTELAAVQKSLSALKDQQG